MLKHLLLTLSLLTSQVATAQEEMPPAETQEPESTEAGPVWFFLGGGGSYVSLKADGLDGEVSKTGYQFHVDGMLSFPTEHWIVDVGGGWLYNFVDNYNAASELVSVETKAGLGILGLRYRFQNLFSAGPVVHVLMALESDVTFAEPDPNPRAQGAAALVGAQVQMQIPLSSAAVRLTGSVLTDATISDRQLYWFMLGAQVGFSFGGSSAPAVTAPAAPPVEGNFYVSGTSIKVTLSDQKVYFETAKSNLTPRVAAAIGQIAGYLAQHPGEWRLVQIDGHADYRGTQDYNYILSANRAAEVGKVFVNAGIPPERVAFKAYGKNRAADPGLSDAALARNRRVEIKITGVKNPQELLIPIDRIWRSAMGSF